MPKVVKKHELAWTRHDCHSFEMHLLRSVRVVRLLLLFAALYVAFIVGGHLLVMFRMVGASPHYLWPLGTWPAPLLILVWAPSIFGCHARMFSFAW